MSLVGQSTREGPVHAVTSYLVETVTLYRAVCGKRLHRDLGPWGGAGSPAVTCRSCLRTLAPTPDSTPDQPSAGDVPRSDGPSRGSATDRRSLP
jgi:hypothetical protein